MRSVMRPITSPMPIGPKPGHLFTTTSRKPLYAIKSSGGIYRRGQPLNKLDNKLAQVHGGLSESKE